MTGVRHIAATDWIVVVLYFLAVVAGGLWLARRQNSIDGYFVGGRNVPGWAAGLSLFATSISTVTFIAYPGDGYGSDWKNLLPGLMLLVVVVFLAYIVVPFYRTVVKVSAYEYLEQRFGYLARGYAALVYILKQLFKMGFILFLAAQAISAMTGWDIIAIIVAGGLVTILYTTLGGIRAVIWTDVLQSVVLFCGGLLCLALLLVTPEGGPARVLQIAREADKFTLADLALDLTRPTILVMMLFGIVDYLHSFTLDQTSVQRYLSVGSTAQARRGLWIGAVNCVLTWVMFLMIGTLLFSYYQIYPQQLSPEIASSQTKVFPHYIVTQLPAGVVGVFLAAMCAAAMSSLDSTLNALSLTTTIDFYGRFRQDLSDQHRLVFAKISSCLFGVVGTAAAWSMTRIEGAEKALTFSFTAFSILGGGLLGVFLLAIFVRRAHALGVYTGLAAGIAVSLWGALGTLGELGLPAATDVVGNFPVHVLLAGPLANVVSFAVGYVASLLLPDISGKDARGLTFWDFPRARET